VRPQAEAQRQVLDQPTTYRPRIRITQAPPTTPAPEPQQLLARAVPQFGQYSPRPTLQDPNLLGGRAFNFDQELQNLQQQQQQQPEAQQQQQQVQYRPQPQQYHQQQQHTFPQRQTFGANAASIFNSNQYQRPQQQQAPAEQQSQNYGNYRTELVYDPASGQYTSVLVQDIPKTNEEFTLTQRLRAFVDPQQQQQPQQFQVQHYGQPQYYQQQQQQQYERQPLFERQQLQFQPSPGTISQLHADAQEVAHSPASGQIDAFLRTLNLSV
jgi:hypothetical protein